MPDRILSYNCFLSIKVCVDWSKKSMYGSKKKVNETGRRSKLPLGVVLLQMSAPLKEGTQANYRKENNVFLVACVVFIR